MFDRFTGKTAVVTGASSGMGRAVAIALGREGARVAVGYGKGEGRAREVVKEIEDGGGKGIPWQVDLRDSDALAQRLRDAVTSLGGSLDVLVNNGGRWMDPTPLHECPPETWDDVIRVNLTSVFHLCRTAASIMIEQKSGAIVNVSSVVARTGGATGTIPYAASKGGVNSLTRGLARELAAHGVRVNGVSPGATDTPMLNEFCSKERLDAAVKTIPLQRLGQPDEIVGAVLLLASDEGSYMTGEVIEVNGGALMD
jgi:3-oxoacyl-[acyl-carrier protein] reductase